jgi:hypothetical protein
MFVLVLLVAACDTPTTVTGAWKDPSYSSGPMRKVLVLGRAPAEASRRNLEDSMVASLERRGTSAMASYRVFQSQTPERGGVQRYLDSEHYDGALVIEFQGIQTQTTAEPWPSFDEYYGTRFQGSYYSNDYAVYTDQFVKVSTTLWDTHSGHLAWGVTTQTVNPWSSTDAIHSLVDKLVATMEHERLVR